VDFKGFDCVLYLPGLPSGETHTDASSTSGVKLVLDDSPIMAKYCVASDDTGFLYFVNDSVLTVISWDPLASKYCLINTWKDALITLRWDPNQSPIGIMRSLGGTEYFVFLSADSLIYTVSPHGKIQAADVESASFICSEQAGNHTYLATLKELISTINNVAEDRDSFTMMYDQVKKFLDNLTEFHSKTLDLEYLFE
jgi:hypothetical protein